ncbi:hypothetical protein LUW77_02480 [Streptomyces radiopugnans]|nr:hypothetical protein LUW77_02480 [Streptomyces radiopugnans]
MAIIDAFKAAWESLSEILRAFGAFMDYLKAVKGGNAGVLFAKAVASGVVALLELAYQALLSGIGKYVGKVGDRLKGVAANLGKKPGSKDEDKPKDDHDPKKRPDPQEEARRAQERTRRANAEMSRRPPTKPKRPRPQPRPTRRPDSSQSRRDSARRPDTRRPDDRTRTDRPDRRAQDTDRDQSRTPARRETEGTKPAPRPRRTTPETRAANRARQTVKAAQNRIRRARQALDRKDRDGRLDRSLDNNARRMRDAYRRRRDLLLDQRRRRQEQKRRLRDQRRSEEGSSESKTARLRKIVARLRPKVHAMLKKGIRPFIFNSALAFLRSWYRLTSLESRGVSPVEVRASINPSETVDEGDRARVVLDVVGEDQARKKRLEEALNISGFDDWLLVAEGLNRKSLEKLVQELDAADQKNRSDVVLQTIRSAERHVQGTFPRFVRPWKENQKPKRGEGNLPKWQDRREAIGIQEAHRISRVQEAKPSRHPNAKVTDRSDPEYRHPDRTATLQWDPSLDRVEFARKALALKRAGARHELFKKSTGKTTFKGYSEADADRINELTVAFKNAVRSRAFKENRKAPGAGRPSDGQIADLLDSMQVDHVVDLQAGGLDSYKNLRLLDPVTNNAMGNQLKTTINKPDKAPYGTLYTIRILWW